MSAHRIAAAGAAIIALLGAPHAGAHGGLSMDEDYCKLRVGAYVMHFVGYQPDTPSGPKEFCEDIPEIGRTVVVLDYLNEELRELPTEVRVIRDTGSEANLEDITVLHLPPKVYPTGSLNFEMNFSEPGKFVGLVTVGSGAKLASRFPFSVGRRYPWLDFFVPVVLVGAGAAALYRYGSRKRLKPTKPSA
jgi:hypothetical protein